MNSQKDSSRLPSDHAGLTIDDEGHYNIYAVEPEMYINEPGDLRAMQAEERAKRRHELAELQEDEAGKLTMEHDYRHKGSGFI
jgi:hypothetical protein